MGPVNTISSRRVQKNILLICRCLPHLGLASFRDQEELWHFPLCDLSWCFWFLMSLSSPKESGWPWPVWPLCCMSNSVPACSASASIHSPGDSLGSGLVDPTWWNWRWHECRHPAPWESGASGESAPTGAFWIVPGCSFHYSCPSLSASVAQLLTEATKYLMSRVPGGSGWLTVWTFRMVFFSLENWCTKETQRSRMSPYWDSASVHAQGVHSWWLPPCPCSWHQK